MLLRKFFKDPYQAAIAGKSSAQPDEEELAASIPNYYFQNVHYFISSLPLGPCDAFPGEELLLSLVANCLGAAVGDLWTPVIDITRHHALEKEDSGEYLSCKIRFVCAAKWEVENLRQQTASIVQGIQGEKHTGEVQPYLAVGALQAEEYLPGFAAIKKRMTRAALYTPQALEIAAIDFGHPAEIEYAQHILRWFEHNPPPQIEDLHLKTGLALGFPECCVRQFAEEFDQDINNSSPALRRGRIILGNRTPQEIAAAQGHAKLSMEDGLAVYVPCDDCAHTALMTDDPRYDSPHQLAMILEEDLRS